MLAYIRYQEENQLRDQILAEVKFSSLAPAGLAVPDIKQQKREVIGLTLNTISDQFFARLLMLLKVKLLYLLTGSNCKYQLLSDSLFFLIAFVSLPMLLFPQALCIIFLSPLSSMIPPRITSHADFIRVPLLSVAESCTLGTIAICSTAVTDNLTKLTPLVFVFLYQFFRKSSKRAVFNRLRRTLLLETFRRLWTVLMKYSIHSLLLSPIEKNRLAMEAREKTGCGGFSH